MGARGTRLALESFSEPSTTTKHHVILAPAYRRRGTSVKREPIQPDAIYSREETADLLGVSLSTIKRLIAAGQLEASRPDSIRRVFIKGSSILKMLEETRIGAVR